MAYYTTANNSTDATWYVWASNSTATTTIQTWQIWNGTSAGTTVSTWGTWVSNTSIGYVAVPYRETEAQREARIANEQRRREASIRAERERLAAQKRAKRLLFRHLTPTQRREFHRDNAFRLIVGDKTYLIRRGRSGNVQLLDAENQPVEQFCIHPIEHVPDEDTMLAQKLLLENDEAAFRRIANITRLRAA